MKVLVSNDDGILSPGIRALRGALLKRGHQAAVIAPMRQQSGVSHAITVFDPLRAEEIRENDFEGTGVYGTPADCVKLGLACLMPWQPDLVLSGINLGKNVGPDVFYSGTIGAAAEGAHAGIPSMAVSHADFQPSPAKLAEAAAHAVLLAEGIRWENMRKGIVINVNYPVCELADSKGVKICPQAPTRWINGYTEKQDPRGCPYWWMTGELDRGNLPPDSDIALLEAGHVVVTPLRFEHTDKESLGLLSHMGLDKNCFNV